MFCFQFNIQPSDDFKHFLSPPGCLWLSVTRLLY
jgi:hypothetical protein